MDKTKCPECNGDLGYADGPPLLACLSCGRVFRTDRGPSLIYTGVRYHEIKEYARFFPTCESNQKWEG